MEKIELSMVYKIQKKLENNKELSAYEKIEMDSFCNPKTKELNLNALAWEAPTKVRIDDVDVYGFVPGDMFYDNIIATLKSYKDVYREKNYVRKEIPNSDYDVIASWYANEKMVSFFFRKHNTFEW